MPCHRVPSLRRPQITGFSVMSRTSDKGALTLESIQRSRATMRWEDAARLATTFRTQIGGVYEVVAAALERDHAHLRPELHNSGGA